MGGQLTYVPLCRDFPKGWWRFGDFVVLISGAKPLSGIADTNSLPHRLLKQLAGSGGLLVAVGPRFFDCTTDIFWPCQDPFLWTGDIPATTTTNELNYE